MGVASPQHHHWNLVLEQYLRTLAPDLGFGSRSMILRREARGWIGGKLGDTRCHVSGLKASNRGGRPAWAMPQSARPRDNHAQKPYGAMVWFYCHQEGHIMPKCPGTTGQAFPTHNKESRSPLPTPKVTWWSITPWPATAVLVTFLTFDILK